MNIGVSGFYSNRDRLIFQNKFAGADKGITFAIPQAQKGAKAVSSWAKICF